MWKDNVPRKTIFAHTASIRVSVTLL